MSHRVILITGASAGIGRSCAITLSKAFPTDEHPEKLVLFLVGRREEELKKTGEACQEGTIIEIQTGDMGKEEDVERIFNVVKEKYGRLDLLFNVSLTDFPRLRPRGTYSTGRVLMIECRNQPIERLAYRRERYVKVQAGVGDQHHGCCSGTLAFPMYRETETDR